MTDLTEREKQPFLPGGAPDQEVQNIMTRLSDLQTWCFLMSRKDSGGMEAGILVQDVRCLIVERLYPKAIERGEPWEESE